MDIELQYTSTLISPADLALNLAETNEMTASNYKGLIKFIVEIDDSIDDLEFTVALRDRLSEIIVAESE